jgi:Tetratricopeptide repeat/Cytochrome c554 and c-prime/Doubled CXXCH motif (Paired_CXXCH_1)
LSKQSRPGHVVCFALAILIALVASRTTAKSADLGPDSYVGNEACARCHAAIYDSYRPTPMAHASGPASENLIAGGLRSKTSGVDYRIYTQTGKVWLSFERPGDPLVRGKRELLYYIGQGRRGRTYLFSVDGFVFESPVNWYTDRHLWDMAPGYANASEAPMNLPALSSCLDCHVSGIRPPIEGTENRYKTPLFAQSGVSCERCHGPGAAHAAGGAIVNPAKLAPARRDAICMQCHLEGNAAIERPGKHLYQFRPGDDLSDYVRYYVTVNQSPAGLGANSQFEALAQSGCKKKSGNAMSCISCHNPHGSPSPEERTAFYRGKCLACHGAAFGEKHHANQPDCTKCHMPADPSIDIAHTEVTDHRIPRRPTTIPPPEIVPANSLSSVPRLVPFPASAAADHDLRDKALAWETLAEAGNEAAAKPAEQLLRQALAESPSDPALLSALGYIEQKRGHTNDSRELYQRALAHDPNLIDAATNLGVLEARAGHMHDAIVLWQSAFQRAPGRSSIGMNLARAFCSAGQTDKARDTTLRVLEFNPDLDAAKHLLHDLNQSPSKCGM